MSDNPFVRRDQGRSVFARPSSTVEPDQGTGRLWAQLADTAQRVSDIATNEGVRRQKRAAAKLVADFEIDSAKGVAELRETYRDNPQGFETAFEKFRTDKVAAVEPSIVDEADTALRRLGASAFNELVRETANRDEQLQRQSLTARLEMAAQDALRVAVDGTPEEAAAAFVEYDSIANSAVGLRLMSEDEVARRRSALVSGATAERVVSEVLRTYQTKGADAALAEIEQTLIQAPVEGLRVADARAAASRARGEIRQQETVRRAELSAVRAEATELRTAMRSGAPIDGQEIVGLATRLSQAGDRAGALRLVGEAQMRQELEDFAGMAPDEQRAEYQRLVAAGDTRPAMLAGAAKEIRETLRGEWSRIEKGIVAGIVPDRAELETLARDAELSGDTDLMLEAADQLELLDLRRNVEGLSPADQAARLAELENRAASGLTGRQATELTMRRSIMEKTQRLMQDDPMELGYGQQRLAPRPQPIDFANPAEGLRARDAAARLVETQNRTGPVAPFTAAELDGLKIEFDRRNSEEKARLLSDLAGNLSGERYRATLAKVAPDRPVLAWAGGLATRNPALASEVLAGEALLKGTPTARPNADNVRTAAQSFFGDALSGLTAAGSPARQHMIDAAVALAARRQASAGTVDGGAMDADVLEQALTDVSGGVVEFNGRKVLAPVPGMSTADFTRRVSQVTDADLSGARTPNGTLIRARDVLSNGRLVEVGEGRYAVYINDLPVRSDRNRPLTLNLKAIYEARGTGR